jgi:hypothetical protein
MMKNFNEANSPLDSLFQRSQLRFFRELITDFAGSLQSECRLCETNEVRRNKSQHNHQRLRFCIFESTFVETNLSQKGKH